MRAVQLLLIVLSVGWMLPKAGGAGAWPATNVADADCDIPLELVASRSFGDRSGGLADIAAFGADTLWAVGSQRVLGLSNTNDVQPLAVRWDGNAWQPVDFSLFPEALRLFTVAAAGSNDVWVGGFTSSPGASPQGAMLHRTGSSWQQTPLPSELTIVRDSVALSPSNVWAVGEGGIAHWNGATWNASPLPDLGPFQALRLAQISAASENELWVVGDLVRPGSGLATPLVLRWNGSAWSIVPFTPNNQAIYALTAVVARDTADVWVVGTKSYAPLALHWNGSQWREELLPNGGLSNPRPNAILALAADDLWAFGNDNYTEYVMHWDGAAWRNLSPARFAEGAGALNSVVTRGSEVWAVGTVGLGSGYGRTLVRRYALSATLAGAFLTRDTSGGSARINVELSAAAAYTVTLSYATSDAGGAAGQDYVATSGTVSIPPCQRTAMITVPLLAADAWKPNAAFLLRLTAASGATVGGEPLRVGIADLRQAPPGQALLLPLLAQPATPPGRIAFAREGLTGVDIAVVEADGSNPRLLTSDPARDTQPAWSPDGTRIAFTSERGGKSDIYIINADGRGRVQLTTNPADDYHAAWSPDGRRIAFVSNRSGQARLYVMNADGGAQTAITPPGGFADPRDDSPSWSPDGTRIVFASEREGPSEIYVVAAAGGPLTRLTNNNIPEITPAWSPDGTRIAFTQGYTYYGRVLVMRPDGGDVRDANPNFDTGVAPTWSRDGSQLAYGTGYLGEIYATELTNREPVQLTKRLTADFDPAWSAR